MNTPKARHLPWKDVRLEQLPGTIERRFVHSDDVMVAQITIKQGDAVPAHRHENEQWTYVLMGSLEFTFGDDQDEVVLVRENEIIHIPSNLLHSAVAREDCFELDIFSPPRKDWIEGTDAYLRGGAEE
jgi:quercetin dioxygenase-like cupin family protein